MTNWCVFGGDVLSPFHRGLTDPKKVANVRLVVFELSLKRVKILNTTEICKEIFKLQGLFNPIIEDLEKMDFIFNR